MRPSDGKPALVLHGGAWEIPDDEVDAHRRGLEHALQIGWEMLCEGRTAVEVVESCVADLEDDPTFDAGCGSVLNTNGTVEMDASIMDGRDLSAGAVAALQHFPNPVRVARKVLEESEHILLAGEGAVAFALEHGFSPVAVESLLTPRERKRLEQLNRDEAFRTPHAFGGKGGTVGAVAYDQQGNIAAATSTGGTPKKCPGRVGDTPLIGCGTYAENGVGGVSCTGWGESIIIVSLAREISEGLRSGHDARSACEHGIHILKSRLNGLGGAICLDSAGTIGMAFNTPRMARACIHAGCETPFIALDPDI
jgi:beta-aspartyl-peptidase (threonine type)